ncbi:MAG: hypothetical protein HKN83_12325 [Gammaproteobacteria bacterium]|nr:hypothetical protein [Gammaproteobacteria bacterium]
MLNRVKIISVPSFLGVVIAISILAIGPVNAEQNPFHSNSLSEGMILADNHGHSKKEKFGKMDTNNDAVVSKDEFLTYAENKFSKKDKDSDGVLTKEEMEVMVPR